MASSSTEGRGFVHLNTPASIHYTGGSVSLAAVKSKKARADTVRLPHSMTVWRTARTELLRRLHLVPFASDVEDERRGDGCIFPQTAASRAPPPFFLTSTTKTADTGKSDEKQEGGGIRIISNHKVLGSFSFTYPDYDGVLSSGNVPEVVTSAADEEEAAALRLLQISPAEMTEEEAEALTELQAMWKARSLGHSHAGSQHRSAAGDHGHPSSSHKHSESATGQAEEEEFGEVPHPAEDSFEDALRLADELLRFS